MKKILLLLLFFLSSPLFAQSDDQLFERLISVDLKDGVKQEGVLSLKNQTSKPTRLVVILPGYPSVVRPVVENNVMTSFQLTGNFLIRARRHLIDNQIATLIVDCPSNSGVKCESFYQASLQRHEDVVKLVLEVKKLQPTIQQIWLIGTSMGTISSAFMPTYKPSIYAGTIHTATITEPYAKNSYRELGDFDYQKITIPQFFIHHREDPCPITTYSGAQSIANKYKLPLITVEGGGEFKGDVCKAFTQHGFAGREKEVMSAVKEIINTGKITNHVINH